MKATEAKKVADVKKAAAEPADMVASQGEAATVTKTAGAESVGQAAGVDAAKGATDAKVAASAAEATATKTAAGPAAGKDLEGELLWVYIMASKRRVTSKKGGSSAVVLKERRTKAARDTARHEDPLASEGGTPSMEAVVQTIAPEEGDELRTSHQLPLASLSFTEIHKALGEVHAAEVKRLTALSRFFVAEAREKELAEARAGYVKESLYREADFWATEAEAAAKRAKSEIADLTKVLEGKGKELEDVIAEHQGKLSATLQERDVARTATTTVQKQLAALEKKHAEELAAEKEASTATILTVQTEKTGFESFVWKMSRQLLGTCKFMETSTPRDCLETAMTRIIKCPGDILAALQYLSLRIKPAKEIDVPGALDLSGEWLAVVVFAHICEVLGVVAEYAADGE
ncbi:hypothetical protein QYE76_068655 [Lolium multiflorum]|uniref:FRIGIDA-like protein n=1 Tax=Lolium multiflorum TaxID=4521 RepID=A0AAD8SH37_LOLMU|nr:hypothetical protein QYE76_068655 [Lolium multiflorum]